MKKIILASCLSLLGGASAQAAQVYYLVTPVPYSKAAAPTPEAPTPPAPTPVPVIEVLLRGADLPQATVGESYAAELKAHVTLTVDTQAVVGDPTWAVTRGALPEGLSLNSGTGIISGTPTTENLTGLEFEVTATYLEKDGSGNFRLKVATPITLRLSTSVLPQAQTTVAYSATVKDGLVVTGMDPATVQWRVTSGALPEGLTLNAATGAISGTPAATAAKSNKFKVEASANTLTSEASFELGVTNGVINGITQLWAQAGKIPCVLANGILQCVTETTTPWPAAVLTSLGTQQVSSFSRDGMLCAILANQDLYCGYFPAEALRYKASGVKKVSVGSNSGCYIDNANDVYCFGRNFKGLLGANIADTGTVVDSSIKISGNLKAKDISVGTKAACLTTTAGAMHCWGANAAAEGFLGQGSAFIYSTVPLAVPGFSSDVEDILVDGEYFTCALKTNRQVSCWGNRAGSYLGTSILSPTVISSLTGAKKLVKGGTTAVCAINTNDTLICAKDFPTYATVSTVDKTVRHQGDLLDAYAGTFGMCFLLKNTTVVCYPSSTVPTYVK